MFASLNPSSDLLSPVLQVQLVCFLLGLKQDAGQPAPTPEVNGSKKQSTAEKPTGANKNGAHSRRPKKKTGNGLYNFNHQNRLKSYSSESGKLRKKEKKETKDGDKVWSIRTRPRGPVSSWPRVPGNVHRGVAAAADILWGGKRLTISFCCIIRRGRLQAWLGPVW